MEYPGSRFTRPWRVALLFLSIAAFLVISPLLILYTAGYHYDWQNGLLKETGAISIDVLPSNAEVYINNARLKSTLPVRLKDLVPQKYLLRLVAPGYYDWQKEITVKPKQTVYVKEISLTKKNEPQLLRTGEIEQLWLSPNDDWLLFTKHASTTLELWAYDIRSDNYSQLTDLKITAPLRVLWSDTAENAVLSSARPPHQQILFINLANPGQTWSINAPAKNPFTRLQWHRGVNTELLFSDRSTIRAVDPATKKQTRVAANNYLDWLYVGEELWTLDYTVDKHLTITRDLLGFPSLFATLDDKATNNAWRLAMVKTGNYVLLQNDESREMWLTTGDQQYRFPGEHQLLSPYNQWLITWSPWELTTYIAGQEPYLLNRSGEQLRQVWPLDKYNTLGLVWNDKITVLYPYYLVTHDLLQQSVVDTAVDSKNRTMYFSGKINGQEGLWKLNY